MSTDEPSSRPRDLLPMVISDLDQAKTPADVRHIITAANNSRPSGRERSAYLAYAKKILRLVGLIEQDAEKRGTV